MFADLSTNLSKYKTIQILLENCICTVNTGNLKNSRLWQLRSFRTMCYGLYSSKCKWTVYEEDYKSLSPVIQNSTVTGYCMEGRLSMLD